MKLIWLSSAALLFALGGLAMKYSLGMTRLWPSLIFLSLFIAGASCQAIAMRSAQMGVVYVVVLGLEAAAATAISVIILGERMTAGRACAAV